MSAPWTPPPAPEATDGDRVVRFIERFCRQTKGPDAGTRLVLRDWQKRVLRELYRTDGGVRVYRQGYYQTPRKTGKSLLGAGLSLYHLFADGEEGAEVYGFAGDRAQARLVFREAARMVEMDPDLSQRLRVLRDTIEYRDRGSIYQVRSAEAYTAHGLAPSFVIFDEVWNQPNELLWEAAVTGSATRTRPLILAIGTPGYDKNTLAGRLHDMGREGRPGFFYWEWSAPHDAALDYRDVDVWKMAHPGAGDFASVEDFQLQCRTMPENAVRRFYLGQWVTSVDAWLPFGAWDGLATERRLEPGEDCVLGFDGSFAGDSTALVACTPDGFFAVLGAWERPAGHAGDGWRVDIAEVEAAILDACRTYGVKAVACDPYRWQRSLQSLQAQGIPVEEYPQAPSRMIPATTAFYDAVVDGAVSHDGNADLARHLGNVFVRQTRLGPAVQKEHRMSARKIDLAIAAIMAYDVARQMAAAQADSYSYPHIW